MINPKHKQHEETPIIPFHHPTDGVGMAAKRLCLRFFRRRPNRADSVLLHSFGWGVRKLSRIFLQLLG